MKAQIIGFGNVAKNLLELMIEEEKNLKCLGIDLKIVSISDSKGTAIDENGLNLQTLLKKKKEDWQGYQNYRKGFGALEAINKVESEAIIELTPSTNDGEPGLSHITAALKRVKDVVTANKGPLVVAFDQLTELANSLNCKLLYEATVSAQLPVLRRCRRHRLSSKAGNPCEQDLRRQFGATRREDDGHPGYRKNSSRV
jgi:homoserine dehydrogenase